MSSVDLTRAIAFRGFALNTVTHVNGALRGCQIDSADISNIDVRQFMEPKALSDGYYMGPVYLGARHVVLTGTVYDTTRAKAFDRLQSLENALYPTAHYIASPSTFGFAPLTFYEVTTGTPLRTLNVRSNGVRVIYYREMFADHANAPHSIPWSASFLAINPSIT